MVVVLYILLPIELVAFDEFDAVLNKCTVNWLQAFQKMTDRFDILGATELVVFDVAALLNWCMVN